MKKTLSLALPFALLVLTAACTDPVRITLSPPDAPALPGLGKALEGSWTSRIHQGDVTNEADGVKDADWSREQYEFSAPNKIRILVYSDASPKTLENKINARTMVVADGTYTINWSSVRKVEAVDGYRFESDQTYLMSLTMNFNNRNTVAFPKSTISKTLAISANYKDKSPKFIAVADKYLLATPTLKEDVSKKKKFTGDLYFMRNTNLLFLDAK
jgi:hypothetical protein